MNIDKKELYPTPPQMASKMLEGINWNKVETILEPSAGKGDLAEAIRERARTLSYRTDLDLDCIEVDGELRSVLNGKELRVVHDDFLTFETYKKYDLIIMNPPFSHGAEHLVKALQMQKHGGGIICLLNAETLKNPCTKVRKALVTKLQEYEAEITYFQDMFIDSQHPTSVEVALVKISIPEVAVSSRIYEELRQSSEKHYYSGEKEVTEIALNDYIKAAVAQYNLEVECGIKLIQEYLGMKPYIMEDIKSTEHSSPIIEGQWRKR